MTDALHQAAVTNKTPGAVIDNPVTFFVEASGHELFCNRHTYGIGETLTQRPGGGFNTRGITVFGMSGRLAMQLTEVFDVVYGQVKTSEVQQRINQHRAVPIGEHEAIPVCPIRISGIVFQIPGPQDFSDVCHPHGGARVSCISFLNSIHGERSNGVCCVLSSYG